jgi:hypothetical protein
MNASRSSSSGPATGTGGRPSAGIGKSFISGLAEERRRQKRRDAALRFGAAECGLVGTSRTRSLVNLLLNLNGWSPVRGLSFPAEYAGVGVWMQPCYVSQRGRAIIRRGHTAAIGSHHNLPPSLRQRPAAM